MLERRHQPVIPLHRFFWRMIRHLSIGFTIIVVCLMVGMMGYHHFEHLNWLDAFVSAAMILSGMGPVAPIQTDAGKLFAGIYALFSGIIFVVVIAILLAPTLHRVLHRFLAKDT